jgi:uncharacterized protein
MLIHLADALSGKTGVMHVEVPLESSRFKMADGISYALKNVSPIDFVITYKEGHKVLIEAKISLVCIAPCSRCLKEVDVPLSFEIEREIDFDETEEQRKEALDEMNFLHEFDLDTEILIHEEIMMNFPVQVLCREDCKGLCPQCGINRNEGQCSCDEGPKDPRMAAIQELFRQSVLENSK